MHPEHNPIDDLFRNKLGNQETPPPTGVWDEVRAQVQFDQVFQQKLYAHEKPVPKRVWRGIQAAIRPGSSSFRFSTFYFPYAAAAVLILAIGLWWLNPTTERSGIKLANLNTLSLAFHAQLKQNQASGKENIISENPPNLWISSTDSREVSVPVSESLDTKNQDIHFSSAQIDLGFSPASDTPSLVENNNPPSSPIQIPTLKNLVLDSKLLAQDSKTEALPSGVQAYPPPSLDSQNKNSKNLPWTVSSLFSPDVNFTSARNLGNEITNQQGKIQYTAGVRLGYSLNERWTVQSGVQYADQGTMQIPRGEQDNYTGSSSFARLGPPMEVKAQIIDVPVVVRYRILGDKLRWYVNSGFNANLTGGASSLLIGTGTEFRANPKISISVEPTLRRTIETMPNLKPNTLGVFTGINYKFQ
jgi:hypothetical protein